MAKKNYYGVKYLWEASELSLQLFCISKNIPNKIYLKIKCTAKKVNKVNSQVTDLEENATVNDYNI